MEGENGVSIFSNPIACSKVKQENKCLNTAFQTKRRKTACLRNFKFFLKVERLNELGEKVGDEVGKTGRYYFV